MRARAIPGGRRRQPDQVVAIRRGEEVLFQKRDRSGHGLLYTYLSLDVGGLAPGALELAYSLDGLDRFRHNAMVDAGAVGSCCWPEVEL